MNDASGNQIKHDCNIQKISPLQDLLGKDFPGTMYPVFYPAEETV